MNRVHVAARCAASLFVRHMQVPESIAVIGWGRFGSAVGERLAESGTHVRGWDPRVAVSPGIAAASAAEAVAGASIVLLAVPVAATESVLASLRPSLTSSHLVIEVGSVKSGPIAALERVLGRAVPWAATHPLFGPLSLALGERPLRAMICPNPLHPGAADRAEAFWKSFGCETIRLDAETHDRAMAQTHALAFFVAKAFLDCGFDLEGEWVPPSVGGIARTVQTARADAGQLFATLHRENPWSGDARARLLEALVKTDAALRAPASPGECAHEEGAALRLPESDEPSPLLRDVREGIDALDREMLRLLAQRMELAMRAARAKASVGRGVRDPRREEQVLSARRESAEALGLDPDATSEIFRSIMNLSRAHQARGSGAS